MSIHIAAYEEKYHERLVDLWERAVRATHDFLPEEDIRHFRTVVENEALRSVEVWVALDEDGEPAGFAGADGRKIEMLFVDPGRQGKGIGRELINHIKKLKGEPLQVDVNEQNPGACAFYERLGFVRVGRSELDGSGKPYPLLHLELRRRSAGWRLDNSYAGLPDMFYAKMEPTPVAAPKLSVLNEALAVSLGLNVSELASREGVEELAGNRIPEGGEPLAQAYAGHQFGHLNMLGDGRAILLGEQIAPDGRRADVQLKGSGPTPYSRRGDGRAALGPMLREYIISEAMHALGIPTTRSLAVVETGESVYRETELPGAILTRIAASHIRVGTFQYAAGRGTPEDVRTLADYTLRRHYPEAAAGENPALALLRSVIGRQAELIARWQLVGFVHGVMNTDNMALSGETIDYGPCAFMDAYDPKTVFSSIDTQGRYAYGNQPYIAAWNLTRFAETLLPLLHEDEAEAVRMAEGELSEFSRLYHRHWLNGMRGKLGLFGEEEEDEALAVDLLALLQKHGADYTNTFVALTFDRLEGSPVFEAAEFGQWQERWQARRARHAESEAASLELMRGRNPAIIPRNHRVEEALDAATNHGDYGAMEKLLRALSDPFAHAPEQEEYARLPERCDAPYRTFCGT